MKMRHTKRVIFAMLCAIFVLLMGTISASALEVTPETTRISVPVEVEATSAIAGAEVEFSWTSGLEYVEFVLAPGLENKIEADRRGKHYAGFFSDSNKFEPTAGKVLMGEFIFNYTSANAETITFSETRVHTVTGETVDSPVIGQATSLVVKRTGGEGNPGTGSDPGNPGRGTGSAAGGGTSTVVLPSATGTSTSAQAQELLLFADQLAQGIIPAGAVSGDAAENAAANSGAGAQIGDGVTPAGAGTGAQIGNGTTPLTASGEDGAAVSPLLWIILLLVVVIAGLFFVVMKNRKKGQGGA